MVDEKSDRPTALVTGANRGLGLETARQLQADGYRVVLTSRTESKGITAARSLDAEGKQVSYHQLDVTDRGSIAALAQDLPNLIPRLDVLVTTRESDRGEATDASRPRRSRRITSDRGMS